MRSKTLAALPFFILCVILSGCAKYSAINLAPPAPLALQEQPVTNGLRIYAKALTPKESKKVLGRDIVAKGIQPVQLYIENHTEKCFLLSKNGISLPLADPEEVAKKFHTSTLARATGYGAAAILFSPIFALPAIVDGIGSAKANDLLDCDYTAKGIKDQTIYPYSQANMILFVPAESYQKSFSVTLLNEKTKAPQNLIASVR